MTEGVLPTQGTKLYMVDALSASVAAVLKMACPTGITGGSGAKDQIETTCLDTEGNKEYRGGLGNTGQMTVPFNFIPTQPSHQLILTALKESGDVIQWMECFSDCNGVAPTLDSDDGLVFPPEGTAKRFNAYVSDVAIDAATNEIVRGTLTLQVSGNDEWQFATE